MNLCKMAVNIIKRIWVSGQHLSKIPFEFFSQTLRIIGSETGSSSPRSFFFFTGGFVQARNAVREKNCFCFLLLQFSPTYTYLLASYDCDLLEDCFTVLNDYLLLSD